MSQGVRLVELHTTVPILWVGDLAPSSTPFLAAAAAATAKAPLPVGPPGDRVCSSGNSERQSQNDGAGRHDSKECHDSAVRVAL